MIWHYLKLLTFYSIQSAARLVG